MKIKIPFFAAALMILAAVAASWALTYPFFRSIDGAAVQNQGGIGILRIALGETCIVLLGLTVLFALLRTLRAETTRAWEEKEQLNAEKARLEDEKTLLREELAKVTNKHAESERALEELQDIRSRARQRAGQTRNSLEQIADKTPAIEGALKNALDTVEEIRIQMTEVLGKPRMESLAPPEPSAKKSTAGTAEFAGALRGTDELQMKIAEGTIQSKAVRELINGIAGSMEKITGLAGMINRISAQTNILSMNAAIESAHAGSAGAGFAVVAEEIKKLAESTETNAKQIQVEVKTIGEKAKAGVIAGEALSKTMEKTGRTVGTIGQFLTALSSEYSRSPAGAPGSGPDLTEWREYAAALAEQLTRITEKYEPEYTRLKTELEKAVEDAGCLTSSIRALVEEEKKTPEHAAAPGFGEPLQTAAPAFGKPPEHAAAPGSGEPPEHAAAPGAGEPPHAAAPAFGEPPELAAAPGAEEPPELAAVPGAGEPPHAAAPGFGKPPEHAAAPGSGEPPQNAPSVRISDSRAVRVKEPPRTV
ncbi:MAG: methyl-accepting chemotaxis protein [Spirochaetaceae bacterium]|jgi:methyl-accepting chemotaxis protein|nr:methyl-accepting chemotaxis protein [Spirochaetaceae bacterium]